MLRPGFVFAENKYTILLSILGLIVSYYSIHVSKSKAHDPSYQALCDISERLSCSYVLTSPYSKGFGVVDKIFGERSMLKQSNGVYGVGFYCMIIFSCLIKTNFAYKFRLLLSISSVMISVYLGFILYFVLQDFCIVCISTYLINFLLLVISVKAYQSKTEEIHATGNTGLKTKYHLLEGRKAAPEVIAPLSISAILIIGIYWIGGERVIIEFWTKDLPQLHGLFRISIYSAIFYLASIPYLSYSIYSKYCNNLCIGDSPLYARELWNYTPSKFLGLDGLASCVPMHWVNTTSLGILSRIAKICFVCCIVGFGGSSPRVMLAASFFLLHGISHYFMIVNHRWHVPTFTMVVLAFANGNQNWSVDAMLEQRFPNYPFPSATHPSSILSSGFARKVALCLCIATLWGGGVSKLLNSGWKWCDGKSLKFYLSWNCGRSPRLTKLIQKHLTLSAFFSLGSIILELGCVFALFSNPAIQLLTVISAIIFHVGIWFTMQPNYWPQSWCYILGVNWELFIGITTPAYTPSFTTPYSFDFIICLFVSIFFIFFFLAPFYRIEWWPITSIPMYSLYYDETFSAKYLKDLNQAKYVSDSMSKFGYPFVLTWSSHWVKLYICSKNDTERMDVVQFAGEAYKYPKGFLNKFLLQCCHQIVKTKLTESEDSTEGTVRAVEMFTFLREGLKSCNWDLPEWVNDKNVQLRISIQLKNELHTLLQLSWN